MAVFNFATENNVVSVLGREITQWGTAENPVTEEVIDPRSALVRGLGGGATRLDRINPGLRVTLSLQPGGSDATFMQGLVNSKANIDLYNRTVIGTLENVTATQGVIVSTGQNGRGGATSITDAVYVLEFNEFVEIK